MADVSISIITATVGRFGQVDRLLSSLSQLDGYDEIQPEILIANNAPDEPKAKLINESGGRICWASGASLPSSPRANLREVPGAKSRHSNGAGVGARFP